MPQNRLSGAGAGPGAAVSRRTALRKAEPAVFATILTLDYFQFYVKIKEMEVLKHGL